MPRLKRSEKLGAAAVRPAPAAPEVAKEVERIVYFLCPLCGRSTPEKRAIKIGYITVDRVDYFGSIEWDPNKAFGFVREAKGRGSFADFEYIGPEEAPELFEAVKARFIQALEEWVNKKWISREELERLLVV